MTPLALLPDRRLEREPAEDRIAVPDALNVGFSGREPAELCPRCGWGRSRHGPGQWDECRDLLAHRVEVLSRRERELEARNARSARPECVCAGCGNCHGPGGCA